MNLIKNKQINSLRINKEYALAGTKQIVFDSKSDIFLDISSLSSIRRLSNLEPIKTINEYYPQLKILNITGSLNYQSIIGNKKSKEYNLYLKDRIEDSLRLVTSYHTEIFPIRRKCYQNLNSVLLDNNVLEVPKYNHAGVTGRTSITKGFNFLTLKKDKRKFLKSSNNKILVEVDFKSCEPFFYLKSNGFDLSKERDVYHWIASNYNVSIKSRDKFKRGILSILYGANEYTTSKVMQINSNTVKRIKEELGINDLKIRLEKEYHKNSFVLNYYGRPITSDNNLVNYWIQSSAVDFCSLAFYYFCKDNNVTPSFFIHDSMTFEIEKERLSKILSIDNIIDPKSNISIPVEFNVLS